MLRSASLAPVGLRQQLQLPRGNPPAPLRASCGRGVRCRAVESKAPLLEVEWERLPPPRAPSLKLPSGQVEARPSIRYPSMTAVVHSAHLTSLVGLLGPPPARPPLGCESSAPSSGYREGPSGTASALDSATAAAPRASALFTAFVALCLGFGNVSSSIAEVMELPFREPEVTTESSKQAVKLVQRLRDEGAHMYGAFWCSHCFEQKQTFGQAAAALFPYVECYPEGWKQGAPLSDACQAAGVRAFPTWVINGRLLEGDLTLDAIQLELDTPAGQPSPSSIAVEEEGASP